MEARIKSGRAFKGGATHVYGRLQPLKYKRNKQLTYYQINLCFNSNCAHI